MNQQIENTATIMEAKEYLRLNANDGASCPCCDQFVKVYRRKITSAMAYCLILLCKRTWDGKFIHVENYLKDKSELPASIRGDFPKLRFWHLIEKKEGEREDGSPRNGYYRITQKGKDFIYGFMKVAKYAFIYNNKVVDWSEDQINIADALNNKFNYKELMGGFVDEAGQLKLV